MDFDRLNLPLIDEEASFSDIKQELNENMPQLLVFLQDNYTIVTLSIETNYQRIEETAGKRIDYIKFVKKEYLSFFSKAVAKVNEESESQELLRIINQYDYLFQIHDSIEDLFEARRIMSEHYIELHSDILLLIRGLSGHTLELFNDVIALLSGKPMKIKECSKAMQKQFDALNKNMLSLLSDPAREDAGALANFSTYSQRLKDKLINFAYIEQDRVESLAKEADLDKTLKLS